MSSITSTSLPFTIETIDIFDLNGRHNDVPCLSEIEVVVWINRGEAAYFREECVRLYIDPVTAELSTYDRTLPRTVTEAVESFPEVKQCIDQYIYNHYTKTAFGGVL